MTAAEIIGRDIPADKADAPCAACGAPTMGGGVRRPVSVAQNGRSVLMMLCSNASACASRYRKGLTAEQFAGLLRNESFLWNLTGDDGTGVPS